MSTQHRIKGRNAVTNREAQTSLEEHEKQDQYPDKRSFWAGTH